MSFFSHKKYMYLGSMAHAPLLVLCALMLGCSPKMQNQIVEPSQDLSTPGSAVKSYMTRRCYANRVHQLALGQEKYFAEVDSEYYRELKKNVAVGVDDIAIDVKDEKGKTSILKISWIPYVGADFRKHITVMLEKMGSEWKITEIREECPVCDSTGKTADLEKEVYPFPKKMCDYCKGKGWTASHSLPPMNY